MCFDDSVAVVLALGAHWQCELTRFLPSRGPWYVLFVPVMCILQHVFLWCLLVSLFIHYVPSAQVKMI